MTKKTAKDQDTKSYVLVNKEPKEEEELQYGLGSWKPRCLQAFNTIRWYVLWTSLFSFFQGFIVNGVINAVITSLETRFELPSTRSGLIASSNNFIALFVVLGISYYGARRNKPRIIAVGILAVAVGSAVFSLPHFMTGVYNYRASSAEVKENVCYRAPNNSTDHQQECQSRVDGTQTSIQNYLYVFILGNALHGVGATPLFTLGSTYIDENTKAEMTSWYLGIIYAAASLGVAAGYMTGGQVLNIYTDIDHVDMATIDISPLDPRWVGAWWIPFVLISVIMLILVLPIAAFPTRLPGSARLMANRRSEAYQMKTGQWAEDGHRSWRDFPKAIFMLIKNPTFLFLSVSSCAEGNIVSGIAAFGSKFMQEKFNTPAAFAGLIMGLMTIPGAGGGMLVGGYLVKRFKLKCRGTIRLNLLAACLAFLTGALFLIECPTQPSAGVNVHYDSLMHLEGPAQLDSVCNAGCGCSQKTYEPVCGMDGLVYFSPCHAGCDENYVWMEGPMGSFKMYQNCSCVVDNLHRQAINATPTARSNTTLPQDLTTAALVLSADHNGDSNSSDNSPNATSRSPGAHQGMCVSDCQLLYVMTPLLFLGMFLTFATVSPVQTATLRCVPESERALAIGFQWLFLRLGGTMPGPLVLGAIIDSACRVWQEVCGVKGSCWNYTRHDMGVRILIWWLMIKFLCIACFFCAQHFYRPPPQPIEAEQRQSTDTRTQDK